MSAIASSSRDNGLSVSGGDMIPNLMHGSDEQRFTGSKSASDYIRTAIARIQTEIQETNLDNEERELLAAASSSGKIYTQDPYIPKGKGRQRRSVLNSSRTASSSTSSSNFTSTPSAVAEFDVSSYISQMKSQYMPAASSSSSTPSSSSDNGKSDALPEVDKLESQAKSDIQEAQKQIQTEIEEEKEEEKKEEEKKEEEPEVSKAPPKTRAANRKKKRIVAAKKPSGRKSRKNDVTSSPRSNGSDVED